MAPTQIFRINKTSPIEDQYLFTNGLGPLTSYMAREGITDIGEGLGEFLHAAEEFHRLRNDSLESYSERKARDKGRKNSTINNIKNSPLIEQFNAAQAEAYRRTKDQAKARKAIHVPLNSVALAVILRQVGKHPTRVFIRTGFMR